LVDQTSIVCRAGSMPLAPRCADAAPNTECESSCTTSRLSTRIADQTELAGKVNRRHVAHTLRHCTPLFHIILQCLIVNCVYVICKPRGISTNVKPLCNITVTMCTSSTRMPGFVAVSRACHLQLAADGQVRYARAALHLCALAQAHTDTEGQLQMD